MSIKATSWAYQQTVGRSSAKFLLVTLASYVKYKDESFEAWCTIECLSKQTELNRKTIIQGLKYLLERNFITRTGKYVGQFKNCPVYQLTYKGRKEVPWLNNGFWFQENDGRHDSPPPVRLNFFQSPDLVKHEPSNEPIYLLPPSDPVEHRLGNKPADHQPSRPCQHGPDEVKASDDSQSDFIDSKIVINEMESNDTDKSKIRSKRTSAPKPAPRDNFKRQTASNRPAPQTDDQPQGTRLPEAWTLPEYWAQWASEYLPHWDVTEIITLSKVFHAHYRHAVGDKGRSEDWFAGWRLWVLRTASQGPGAGSQHASRGKPASNYHDQLRQLAAEVGLGDAWPGETTAAYQARIVAARASRANEARQKRVQ